MNEIQVLVVGAGPTGLVLAAELLSRGIRTRIIDQGDGVALQSRAIGIHARSLEVLDMMGLARGFIELGQVVHHLRFYSQGQGLARLDFARCGSRFGFLLDLPQDQTERLLRARIGELGGVIENGAELTGLTVRGDGVTAAIHTRAGGTDTSTAAYVVGCDGAHSRVRHELGLTFHGRPYPQDWLLADVRLDWDRAEDSIHAFFQPEGLPLICFPMRGHQWRVTLPFAGDRGGQPPTLAEIQELTDQRAPEPLTLSEPTWLANFRCHRRSASAYRRGRVLLAGDAVHIHTPAGGQGLNTGITDAHNLGWKLALVASGRAPDALLDSYGTERRPVADEVLKLTDALVHYGTMRNPVKRTVRDIVVPVLGRVPALQRRAARRISQVYVAYPPDRPTLPGMDGGRGWGRPRPGRRMPDIELTVRGRGTTLYAVLRGGRHVLVLPVADPEPLLPGSELWPYRRDLEIATMPPGQSGIARHRGATPIILIRPDGYVAALGSPARLSPVTGYLRTLFGQASAQRSDARSINAA